jgi:DNA-binding transcriptional LysR family regulator
VALGSDAAAGLRILVVPSLAVRALPDALRLFLQQHPDMSVAIHVQHSRDITQAIALQEADVGIVYEQGRGVFQRRIDEVQHRHAECGLPRREPQVGGVAGHHDQAGTRAGGTGACGMENSGGGVPMRGSARPGAARVSAVLHRPG